MIINAKYPNCTCPKIIFNPIPFHPLVDPNTGELDTLNAFPGWSSTKNKLYELLLFVKRIFYSPQIYIENISELVKDQQETLQESSPNNEFNLGNDASAKCESNINSNEMLLMKLCDTFLNPIHTLKSINTFNHHFQEYQEKVEEFISECAKLCFDNPSLWGTDENAIKFVNWQPNIHEPFRDLILSGRVQIRSNFCASYRKDTENVAFAPSNGETDQH